MRSKAHIERGIVQKGESSFGRIELHRGSTEVEQDAVHRVPMKLRQLRMEGGVGGLRQMDAPLVRSQGLASERERLRVHIETQQLPIWRRCLQNAAGMSARAYRPIHIAATAPGLQRVYNLLVKYRLMRCVHNTQGRGPLALGRHAS